MQADQPRETVDELKGGTLSTIDAVAMAIAVLSPAMAMAYNTTFAASFSGTSTPFAFLLGGIACLALAVVVIAFTRQMASAGYAYTYTSRSLGQGAGFMTGWLYFFGFFCFVPMTMSFGEETKLLPDERASISVPVILPQPLMPSALVRLTPNSANLRASTFVLPFPLM